MNTTTQKLQTILKLTYGIVPIVAGLDKFSNLLVYWPNYLSEGFTSLLPVDGLHFMYIVGIVEIIAGVLTLFIPRIGAFVVMGWLISIAVTLIAGGHYFDVAVRDLVMAVGAYTLGKLSIENNSK